MSRGGQSTATFSLVGQPDTPTRCTLSYLASLFLSRGATIIIIRGTRVTRGPCTAFIGPWPTDTLHDLSPSLPPSLLPSLFPNVRYFRGRGKQSVFPYRSSAGNVRSPILTRSRSRIRRGGEPRIEDVQGFFDRDDRMREKEEKFHSTLDDKTVESSRPSPSSVPRCDSIIITTERNRTTLSIFPRFNYATKPENRNKTLSFK